MSNENVTQLRRRALTKEDLVRMRIPSRYWEVTLEQISDEETYNDDLQVSMASPKNIAKRYMRGLLDMRRRGLGLLLWGPNGTGKTSLAVVVAKEFRRQFNTVLYVAAADLKRLVAAKEHFDEDETYWQRAIGVDVLLLDDFGKGSQDSKGFGKSIVDELIRERNAAQRVTIITTNLSLDSGLENGDMSLRKYLMVSTMDSLKEHVIPVQMEGDTRRGEAAKWAAEKLLQR